MHYLWLAILGLIIGAIAKLLTPGRDPGGCIVTMIVGLIGVFVGSFIAGALGFEPTSGLMWFIISVIGAMIVLALYHALFGRRKTL